MLKFCDTKDVITRKPHRCGFCNRVIPAKSKVQYSKGLFDDYFFRSYLDDFCKEIIDIFREDYCDDGYNEDCFAELELNIQCTKCGNAADLLDNDIANRKIVFECEECEEGFAMNYSEVLLILKSRKDDK
jgi:hypothetical protein